ncbi:anti-sigma factor family protein [Myxococcus sp. 1LA]
MKPQNAHAQEDRLLDFAYGELPVPEARIVEAHLQGCARCTQALDDIRGVRATMSQLAVEPAPDAGLESLMAYAQQAARRAAAGPEPKPSRWRRWLLPVVGLASVSTFGILTLQARSPELTQPDLSAAKAAPQALKEERAAPVSSEEFAPAPTAAAPAPAAMPERPPKDDAWDGEPRRREVAAPSKKSMEAEPPREAKLRAENWSNAGSGGGLDMGMRGERESKGKRMAPAPSAAVPKADMARKAPRFDSQALEGAAPDEESGVPIGGLDRPAPKEVASAGRVERRVPDSQAPGAVPPRDSLRIGSKAPAARGMATADEWEAAPEPQAEFDDAAALGVASAPAAEKPAAAAAPPPRRRCRPSQSCHAGPGRPSRRETMPWRPR